MSRQRLNPLTLSLCAVLALSACEGTKKQLGLTRSSPDEFAVVKRAPLAMPPDFSLRPPRPGAPRPQEQAVSQQAREAVFGAQAPAAAPDNGETALLQKAGAVAADPAIRQTLDQEAAAAGPEKKSVPEKILGIKLSGASAKSKDVLDPKEEKERLEKEKAAAQIAPAAP